MPEQPVLPSATSADPNSAATAPAAPPAFIAHLTQDDLAARWRMSPRTLERWRQRGIGPVYVKLPGRAIYRLQDALAFEEAHLAGRRLIRAASPPSGEEGA